MSRLASMLVWFVCASIHLSILIYISPLLLQLIIMGALEGIIGILTWKMHRAMIGRTINEIDRYRRARANRKASPVTHGQYQDDYPLRRESRLK